MYKTFVYIILTSKTAQIKNPQLFGSLWASHNKLFKSEVSYGFVRVEEVQEISFMEKKMRKNISQSVKTNFSTQKFIDYIRDSIIGEKDIFVTPYGERKFTYCDYIASGKGLTFIEQFIQDNILATYANTHTTSSVTGLQTSYYVEEAREIIFNCLKGNVDDTLIFCGQGTTTAINLLVDSIFKKISDREDVKKVVVFISFYEHHSNILPWREKNAEVVVVREGSDGGMDLEYLQQQLELYSKDKSNFLIGSFSACSNVTGILTETTEITRLLKRYGALAFFDYASCAPYVPVEMNNVINGKTVEKDAIFFSTHKFLGGTSCPGVLCVKKKLLKKISPYMAGGGTVFFVTEKDHLYQKKLHFRYEAGTPNIIGNIKAGVVFYVKKRIGDKFIKEREDHFTKKAFEVLSASPQIVILGSQKVKRISVVTFLVKHHSLFLHANFVSKLLNDLFGIQSRSGCMCAGPYSQRLLGLGYKVSKEFEDILHRDKENNEFLRPGYTRLNFHYYLTDETFQYILDAILFVAENGWKFLVDYSFNPRTGEWFHALDKKFNERKWLHNISFENNVLEFNSRKRSLNTEKDSVIYERYFKEAREILKKIEKKHNKFSLQKDLLSEEVKKYRWFVYPYESFKELEGNEFATDIKDCIIKPKIYEKKKEEKKEEEVDFDFDDNPLQFGSLDLYEDSKVKKEKVWSKPSHKIMSKVMAAVNDFGMIQKGDRIMLGLSGGKDSLTMLHILFELNQRSVIKFEFAACTIDPQTSVYNPSLLKNYVKKLGVPYFYESQAIIELAKEYNEASICSFCSRMKRGILYSVCRKNGYNKLILAQHLDDQVESFMMSIFHNGLLRTMKANYLVDEGDIRVIRPLVYCREGELKEFAKENNFPVIYENCPACFSDVPKERERIKKLMKKQEQLYPTIYDSLRRALKPLFEKEIVSDDRIMKSFKTRKQKDVEDKGKEDGVSCLSGRTKKLQRQLNFLRNTKIELLYEEIERRKKRKETKK